LFDKTIAPLNMVGKGLEAPNAPSC
jgi:hypothetical protein